jgi:carboxymethylenebutenolidase
MSVATEKVEITVGSEEMGAYVARPDGGESLPAVIVYMEIFGVNDHIQDVTRRVADLGYVAIAPDYFHRTAPGMQLSYDDAGMEEGMKHLGALQADQMIADAQATLDYLRSRGDVKGDAIGAMGFCIGGHMTYLTAATTDVKAAAAFYGGGIAAPQGPGGGPSTVSRTGDIKGHIVCLFGGQDSMIPDHQVETIREALEAAGTSHEIVIYPKADHGFFCDQRPTYNADAAEDAWQRVQKLFAAELKS